MKNLLIMTSGYCGKATANGLCAQALVEALEKENICVHVVSCEPVLPQTNPDGRVLAVQCQPPKAVRTCHRFLGKLWNRIMRMLQYTWIPEYDKQTVERLVEAAGGVCRRTKIDGIICMFFPLETVVAGWLLKKQFTDIPLLVYELDSVTDGIGGSGRWNWDILFAYRRYMDSIYKTVDCIMVLKCHEECWLREHSRHAKRMRIVDLPLIFPANLPLVKKSRAQTQLLYAGELSLGYRSPRKLLAACHLVKEPYQLHFYSKGCEDLLREEQEKNDRIYCHGYVSRSTLSAAVAEADIMLSVGNQVSNSLPSKIITYMSYGKPIIHYSLQPDDVCKEYLKRYPLALVLEWDTGVELAALRIAEFMRDFAERRVPFDAVAELFPMNLPYYSVSIIRECTEQG